VPPKKITRRLQLLLLIFPDFRISLAFEAILLLIFSAFAAAFEAFFDDDTSSVETSPDLLLTVFVAASPLE